MFNTYANGMYWILQEFHRMHELGIWCESDLVTFRYLVNKAGHKSTGHTQPEIVAVQNGSFASEKSVK